MSNYLCKKCGYLYSELDGDSKNGVSKGTTLEKLEGTMCSMCWMKNPKRYNKFDQPYCDMEAQYYLYICGKFNFSFYEKKLIEKYSKESMILEVGCGTGRCTQEFIKAGYTVHALEESEEMLEVVSKQKWAKNDTFQLLHKDYFNYGDNNGYDLIYFGDTTFQELVQQRSLKYVLEKADNFLRPGGEVWLELMIPSEINWEFKRRKLINPQKTLYFFNSGEVNLFSQIIYYTSTFEIYLNGKFQESYRQERELALLFARDIKHAFKEVFDVIEEVELPKIDEVIIDEYSDNQKKVWVDGGYPLPRTNKKQRSLFLRLRKREY
ncbi:methyltransferase domain-containing protein [Vagococcus fessus]|uniref:Methyltransferase domain-containing protein n=1 Tax=Vagococcus fessus TaxID=120370 RepID=A0A430A597_9ENTE|nr:class I SAM-dependent methyltransferase [Vagococcus fessus]RSU01980.1 hypothetical protein CBF31_09450 [Vagococcus fessus]